MEFERKNPQQLQEESAENPGPGDHPHQQAQLRGKAAPAGARFSAGPGGHCDRNRELQRTFLKTRYSRCMLYII